MTTMALAVLFSLLPAALGANFEIQVGPGGDFVYNPSFINAAKGDQVTFIFNPKNHTVTQSSFDAPCVPLVGGATSGFKPVSNVSALLPQWDFTIADDTKPSWFFCEQTGHCGKGMVFAINPPADPDPHSFTAFQNLAIALNGTSTGSSAPPSPSQSDAFTTPPDQPWETATATITHDASTWTSVYTSYKDTPSPTYAAMPVNHLIRVGADGLTYTPSNISAALGDTVTFEFHPKNHTVTQSSFLQPCKALGDTSTTGQVGFKSGFKFVADDATEFPTFQITINDTAPIWGYCGQPGHCTAGMVFSINAVESGPNNFGVFQELARRTPNSNGVANGSGTNTASAPGSSKTDNAAGVARPIVWSLYVVLGLIGVGAGML